MERGLGYLYDSDTTADRMLGLGRYRLVANGSLCRELFGSSYVVYGKPIPHGEFHEQFQ